MIIFDLDGTLANCEHRRHFVQKPERCDSQYRDCICHKCDAARNFSPDWDAFYEACDKDSPIYPTIQLWDSFEIKHACHPGTIVIWSGRSESVRSKTIAWLERYLFVPRGGFNKQILKMRPIGDTTPDEVLKKRWLDEAIAEGKTIEYVFDDRPKVIRTWRENGIFVFNCNQTGGEF